MFLVWGAWEQRGEQHMPPKRWPGQQEARRPSVRATRAPWLEKTAATEDGPGGSRRRSFC